MRSKPTCSNNIQACKVDVKQKAVPNKFGTAFKLDQLLFIIVILH